jgi:hypothetical protein
MNRKQDHKTRPGYGPKWTETEIRTFESWDRSCRKTYTQS